MKKIKGNLVEIVRNGEADVVIHGCNCQQMMGAGIAFYLTESTAFPEIYQADLAYGTKGDPGKLGTFSTCKVGNVTVVNAYTQELGGRDLRPDALKKCFEAVKKEFGGKGLKIMYPLIGCGIAGGIWDEAHRLRKGAPVGTPLVADIIDKALEGEDHTLVVL